MTNKEVARQLKECRLQSGITLQGAADKLNVSKQSVCEYENGRRTLNVKFLNRYCEALKLDWNISFHQKKS